MTAIPAEIGWELAPGNTQHPIPCFTVSVDGESNAVPEAEPLIPLLPSLIPFPLRLSGWFRIMVLVLGGYF